MKKKPTSKSSPKPAVVKVVVHDPPKQFDGKGWEDYQIVRLDARPRVLLVGSHGQEIRFVTGQSSIDDIKVDTDSSKQSPSAKP